MTWMIIRLILSLAFVAGVLFMAAKMAKKRGLGAQGGLIEVVARQRMGRSSAVTVLRIGDRVLVVGATEEHITLLGEMDPESIEDAVAAARPAHRDTDSEDDDPEDDDELLAGPRRRPAARHAGGVTAGSVLDRAAWTSMVQELRERTVRR